MEEDIIDKLEDIRYQIEENRKEIQKVDTNLEIFAIGASMVGINVGYGADIGKAIWISLGILFVIYMLLPIYRENKRKKTLR
ncbi:MAG: hypothetical protein JW787_02800 [Sedimentisphaerales bacterium]|nr:hypothetical protein [Sedimentisphaerales bacterium]